MRITQVSLFRKNLPMLCSSFTCSLEPGVSSADVVIVKIDTDAGFTGYGEVGAVGGYPNYAGGILSSSAELIERHLLNQDPRDLNQIQQLMSMIEGLGSIKAGFDIACWDILGQALQQPIYALLGGKLQEKIPLYRGIPLAEPETMRKEIAAWRMEGFKFFLMKVGSGDLAQDIECISAVMSDKQAGEHFTVDVSGRWRVDEALQVLKAVRRFDFVLEQPCWRYEDCLSVRRRTDRPMKLDNVITDLHQVLRAQSDRACELMTLKIDKLGGLSPARIARDITATAGISVTIEAQWATEITTAAVTHLAMTTAPNRLLASTDLHGYSSLSTSSDHNLVVENGLMYLVGNQPGLGITVNPDALGQADIVLRA